MLPGDLRMQGTKPSVSPDDWRPAAIGYLDRDTLLASANRACCCPARPAVVVLMPPTRARPHCTDMSLCRHHYRVSRHALAAAGAIVLDPESQSAAAGTCLEARRS
jgi:hypothetical protein